MQAKQLRTIKRISIAFTLLLSAGAIAFFLVKKNTREKNSFDKDIYASKYPVHGVDLSHHNPIINWAEASHNLAFVYLKVTEGNSHLDRNYKYNYQSAQKSNLRIGSYHFYTFGLSGKEQANHFLRNAKSASGDLLPAIDVEHSPLNVYSKDTTRINLVIKELKVLENEIYEHFGIHPLIYTNRHCYKLYVKDHLPNNPIWMCDLQLEPNEKDVKNWIIWQFSHKGKMEGVKGEIDLNYFRYGFEELKKYLLP